MIREEMYCDIFSFKYSYTGESDYAAASSASAG